MYINEATALRMISQTQFRQVTKLERVIFQGIESDRALIGENEEITIIIDYDVVWFFCEEQQACFNLKNVFENA